MNYIGSKHSLLPFIQEEVLRKVLDGSEQTACDIFAGTGAVGRMLKRLGLRVIANDIQHYAYALNKAYLEINQPPGFTKLRRACPSIFTTTAPAAPVEQILTLLNGLEGVPGFIADNYGPAGERFYFSIENAEKTDAIRQIIEQWLGQKIISKPEYFYLLASLLEAIDQVANTASVYGAFLKKFKASALRPLTLKPLALSDNVKGCKVYQCDANELIRRIECDVLYLDPPYNHRQYGANYHVLETIAAYDSPQLKGVTGMRDYPRSRYCQMNEAAKALEDLIVNARAKHILLSYNDEGVISREAINRILSLRGKPQTFEQKYSRFKADNGREYKRDSTTEFIHYVRVEK
ncbi:MAG: DNA adenine methylase [Acidobacteriota bacterium]